MEDLTGKSIDRYEITGLIASGGMAYVYRAYDSRLNRIVAIKLVRAESFSQDELPTLLERFKNEVKIIANLSHPNIVKVFDYGEFEGVPYLVMELVEGETLRSLLTKPVNYTDAAELLIPIADALSYMHENGFLHRDIKPSNIIVRKDGVPILMDFGIARTINDSETNLRLTKTGVGIGTPDYMAPEQAVGKKLDGRTDEYALAAVYYEMITGKKLYGGETPIEVMMKHYNAPIPSAQEINPDIPDEVDLMLQKALAKNSDERYSSMKVFSTELRKIAGQSVRTNPIFSRDQESDETTAKDEKKNVLNASATVTTGTPVQAEKSRRPNLSHLTGKKIDKYQVTGLIEAGGMAYVYRAFDPNLHSLAIKLIKVDRFSKDELPILQKRFQQEARIMASLHHPHIVKVFDSGTYEGTPYIVMELIEGKTLQQYLGKPIPYDEAAEILIPIADALSYVHKQNEVHRDVKPSNIMIRDDGFPILMDSGIAKAVGDSQASTAITQTGKGIGTPAYMAPEQIAGNEIDGRTDEYALGLIYFEMITGRKPYDGSTPIHIMMKHLYDDIPSARDINPAIPEEADQLIYKVLAKDPDDRFPTVEGFAAELRKLSGQAM